METLIGAGLIGVAIVIAAALYGRSRPAVAALPSAVVVGAAPAPEELELTRRAAELERSAERTHALEAALDRRSADLDRREAELERRDQHLRAHATELERLRVEREGALERIAGLSAGQAKQALLKDVEDDARHESVRVLRQVEEETKRDAERRVRSILSVAMQRLAASHAAETTVSVVQLPSDDMKGRIIGREGRNIRALENLTGVDFIIDDTPNAVVLSAFDGVRREIARMTLEKLLQDGRIHPARIEETFYQAKS
ncbi:MAG: ribonucrease, partial [Solirubrobacteraceae bacterium]|nr:ribonucrease [Solirubrobacteraceae bacterium]